MADNEQRTDKQNEQGNGEPYEKMMGQQTTGTQGGDSMATDRSTGSVGGGTVSSAKTGVGSGTPEGGRSTSNSTVSGGGTVGGGNIGAGATTDRGSMKDSDISTNTGNSIFRDQRNSEGEEMHIDQSQNQTGGSSAKRKGSSPLSQEEADKINQDAKQGSSTTVPPDTGHES